MASLQFTQQTLQEAWDEYLCAPVDKFPARSFELLFQAVKDLANYLESQERERRTPKVKLAP